MARIRSVKPEIRRSLTVAEWPHSVRLAWIYLWMFLDDEGRGLDDMRLIVAELFPLDRNVSESKMNKWLNIMATTKTSEDDVPPLCRYEVQGRRYLHAVNWQHQKINRPQDSRLPQCPIHDSFSESRSEPNTEQSVNGSRNGSVSDSPPSRAPADQGSGSMEHGARDQGGAGRAPKPPDRFDEFWDAYPKRVGRQAARRRWDILIKRGVDPAEIIAGARIYAEQMRGTDPQFVKQAEGWLNAGRWEDEAPKRPKERDPGWQYGMGD